MRTSQPNKLISVRFFNILPMAVRQSKQDKVGYVNIGHLQTVLKDVTN